MVGKRFRRPFEHCLATGFSPCSGRQEKDYCSKHYYHVIKYSKPIITRFDKRPAIIDGDTAKIALGVKAKDGFAIVDISDAWVDRYNWSLATIGYAQARVDGKLVLLHALLTPKLEGKEVDHANLNRLDNRRSNLRLVTHGENMYNLPLAKNNVSGVRGVDFDKKKKKWRAQIQKDGKNRFIGYFNSIDEAKKARSVVEKELFVYTSGQKIDGWVKV